MVPEYLYNLKYSVLKQDYKIFDSIILYNFKEFKNINFRI